ncbi:MAG: nickel-dependent hydrogenase large subunit [Rhodospirillales bacterium]|nr:nickel-dependent hydrogenase large subunit [Rhodospirillales bacterium]
MANRVICDIPLNRVEGDLEIKVAVEDGRVVDAWSSGTMFRGFERMLVGRAPLDGLVITPRICGICSLTHLTAAAKALDGIAGVAPPPNAGRLRNVALMAETMQSDVRQSVLMHMNGFANVFHSGHDLYDQAVARYASLAGERSLDVVRQTKRIVEIIALIGGQWPHTSFMVPGGVVYAPPVSDILKCRNILSQFRSWYEGTVLGCPTERWLEVDSRQALEAWLAESSRHRESDVGFLIRFGLGAGLGNLGRGYDRFLSYGSLELPEGTTVAGTAGRLVAAGFAEGVTVEAFDQARIAEHVASSWYRDYPGGRHPFDGETEPVPSGDEGGKYSWSKAPRYKGLAAETGPLAERIVAGDPLFRDLIADGGANALVRQLARLTRPTTYFQAMDAWLGELIQRFGEPVYHHPGDLQDGEGIGLCQAARGALGHWVRIKDGRIAHYQIITPTAWNGAPRDSEGLRGPWEEALIGIPVSDPDNPALLGHVVRSFDPCLVCTVHVVGASGRRTL